MKTVATYKKTTIVVYDINNNKAQRTTIRTAKHENTPIAVVTTTIIAAKQENMLQ